MAVEIIELTGMNKQIRASEAMLADSSFKMVCLDRMKLDDVAAVNARICNADLSNLEIVGAQLGGAYLHDIGMPPEGHPFYDPEAVHQPLKFQNCDLQGSEISNCDLRNLQINNSNTTGMMVNGVLLDDLWNAYNASKG